MKGAGSVSDRLLLSLLPFWGGISSVTSELSLHDKEVNGNKILGVIRKECSPSP
jgi:predicted aconitase with swiveling domain